jgi:hypothetical protein
MCTVMSCNAGRRSPVAGRRSPVAGRRGDVGTEVVGVVLPGRGLRRVTHRGPPLGEEHPNRAPGYPDIASAAMPLLRRRRGGACLGLGLEAAAVLSETLRRELHTFLCTRDERYEKEKADVAEDNVSRAWCASYADR